MDAILEVRESGRSRLRNRKTPTGGVSMSVRQLVSLHILDQYL